MWPTLILKLEFWHGLKIIVGFNYIGSHILTTEAYMECSKLLEIDMRATHSPSSSACLVLSGAPVAPVLINPQTHCYSNKI